MSGSSFDVMDFILPSLKRKRASKGSAPMCGGMHSLRTLTVQVTFLAFLPAILHLHRPVCLGAVGDLPAQPVLIVCLYPDVDGGILVE